MMQRLLAIAAVVAGFCQVSSLYASCPATMYVYIDDVLTEVPVPNQIFCDDFDSYCDVGGPPGTPGCTDASPVSTPKLQQVWWPAIPGGTTMIAESGAISDYTSGRFTNPEYMGQEQVRDWVASEGQPEPVLNIQRFINNVHGGSSNAVNGTDNNPLVMKFQMAMGTEKLFFSAGYMELALGNDADPLNRTNTDYAPQTANCCNESGRVFPVICAQGNPDSPLPAACPNIGTTPPPVHQAIAVGALSSLDNDPCDGCNSPTTPTQYRQNVRHLTLFDGKVWWTLNGTNLPPGATVSGSLTDEGGNTVSPPEGYFPWLPGDFYLVSTVTTTVPGYKTQISQCYNNVELTVYATTMTVKLISRAKLNDDTATYITTSIMENIPRQYTGAFDRLRVGVSPGCTLASNTDWSTCVQINGRFPLLNITGNGVVFDRFLLTDGVGVEMPGACCKADGTCEQMLKAACEALDINGNPMGRFTSVGQACNDSIGCCPLVYGDSDLDNDVDMDDFAKLQACLTTGGGTIGSSCQCLNTDGDNDIDADDILKFVDCANGPGVAADAGTSCRGPGW